MMTDDAGGGGGRQCTFESDSSDDASDSCDELLGEARV